MPGRTRPLASSRGCAHQRSPSSSPNPGAPDTEPGFVGFEGVRDPDTVEPTPTTVSYRIEERLYRGVPCRLRPRSVPGRPAPTRSDPRAGLAEALAREHTRTRFQEVRRILRLLQVDTLGSILEAMRKSPSYTSSAGSSFAHSGASGAFGVPVWHVPGWAVSHCCTCGTAFVILRSRSLAHVSLPSPFAQSAVSLRSTAPRSRDRDEAPRGRCGRDSDHPRDATPRPTVATAPRHSVRPRR